MNHSLTAKEIRELERQLSCPTGAYGIEVGNNMNETNSGMTISTIEFLALEDKHSVLELGHGNCGHLEKLLAKANEIHYHGLEISETMCEAAKNNNSGKQAEFGLYNGEIIPYKDDSFDRVFSVNTIYFWSNPDELLNEIGRVLKPDGLCILTYADKTFMQNLPFVGDKFKLFDKNDIQKLVAKSNLSIVGFKDKTELVKSKMGEKVERTYTMVKIKRL